MYNISLVRSNHSFRIFWISEAIESVSMGLVSIALPWFILTFAGNPLQLGIAFALRSAPDIVVAPIIGGLTDRYSRIRLTAVGQIATGILIAVLPVLFLIGRLAVFHIYVVMICYSIARNLSHNASRAVLPNIVGEGNLDQANSLLMGVRSGGKIVFVFVGGTIIAISGPIVVLLGATVASILAGSLIAFLSFTISLEGFDRSSQSYVDTFLSGVKILASTPILLHLLFLGVIYNFFVVPYSSIIIPSAAQSIFGNALSLTIMLGSWFVGDFFGNGIVGRWTINQRFKMTIGVAIVGFGTLLTGGILLMKPMITPQFWIFIITGSGLFIAGFGQPFFNVPSSSLLQTNSPTANRGTVVTVQNSILQASFPLPLLLSGFLLQLLEPDLIFIGAGIGLITLAGFMNLILIDI
ncbi:MAG: MFS transporter [Halobacteriaceae archaeon]